MAELKLRFGVRCECERVCVESLIRFLRCVFSAIFLVTIRVNNNVSKKLKPYILRTQLPQQVLLHWSDTKVALN